MPLVDGGVARVQPVFVHDVARAVFKVATSEDPDVMLGQTYDIAGACTEGGGRVRAARRAARGGARPTVPAATASAAAARPAASSAWLKPQSALRWPWPNNGRISMDPAA